MELKIDNRIILALAEVAGSSERELDNIFVICKDNENPIYFATDGSAAIRVEEKSPEFKFTGDYNINLPIILKKVLKYNKKEPNQDMNYCFIEKVIDEVKVKFFNGDYPYSLRYNTPSKPKFDKIPDVFNTEGTDKKAIAFNPAEAQKINKALTKLGFDYAPTFLLDADLKMCGTSETKNFVVQYVLMGCRPDEE